MTADPARRHAARSVARLDAQAAEARLGAAVDEVIGDGPTWQLEEAELAELRAAQVRAVWGGPFSEADMWRVGYLTRKRRGIPEPPGSPYAGK